jgi:ubiquinone/menaquinone biosynthesis C-methylase UbiE
VPALGRIVGVLTPGSRAHNGGESTIAQAYTYLPSSVKRFPGPPALAAEMERAGLVEIGYVITAGGIVAIHLGAVPEDRAS